MPPALPTPQGFPPQIQPAFDQLRNDMIWLAWKLELFRNGFLNPTNREVLFERTAAAFMLIEDSLMVDMTISIARLMDPPETGKKENLTLRYLFELIRAHGNAPTLLATVEARYAALASILNPISDLRNKVMAHRDRPTALTAPLQLPLTAQDIIRVCKEFQGIINDIDAHFAESCTLFDFQVSYSNIDSLVQHLHRGNRAMDEDHEREMEKWMPRAMPEQGAPGHVQ